MTTPDEPRPAELDERARAVIAAAREKARVLYEGTAVPHRSCGIALAETFGIRPGPYQALRRGGITGLGECGAIKAGELILGELLGDPDPTGPVTPQLREAALFYRRAWSQLLTEPLDRTEGSVVCDDLVSPFPEFLGPERHSFCTNLAETVAGVLAETLLRHGVDVDIEPIREEPASGTDG